jgi:hypothetical protein
MTEREESPAAVARAEAQEQLQHHDAVNVQVRFQ